jgi:DNA-binding NarL/FixJ family response regulator
VAGPSGTRVLMLTAASTVKERVDGLGLGADDYLPKPFDFAELVARVRALARRSVTPLPPVLEAAGVSLDPNRRVAFRAGRRLDRLFQPFQQLGHERTATATDTAWAWPSPAPSLSPTKPRSPPPRAPRAAWTSR